MDQVMIVRGWFNHDGNFGSNEDSLNELLSSGEWTVKMVTPLGAYGYGYAAAAITSAADAFPPLNLGYEGSDNGFAALLVLTNDR